MRMGTILIIVGAVLMGAGVVVNMLKPSPKEERIDMTPSPRKKEISSVKFSTAVTEVSSAVAAEPQPVPQSQPMAESCADSEVKQPMEDKDFKQMGNDFEGYVADILKANGIRLKQWNQGSTSPGGAYAENELNPDFFVSHKEGEKPLEYWVECKYRSNLTGAFSLEDYQLNRYKSIQGSSKRKIVIALGVGGSPSSPAEFYVIPLDTLSQFKRIGQKYLPHYRLNNPQRNFKAHLSDWFYNDVFKKKKSSN